MNLEKYVDLINSNFTNYKNNLNANIVDTILGVMISLSDGNNLLLLDFIDNNCKLEKKIKNICNKTKSILSSKTDKIISSIKEELNLYFSGKLKSFKTPIKFIGTKFQWQVWEALRDISYGETISYLQQSKAIKKPLACRAVANANGANYFAIVVPCHRVINSNGALGGYASGLERKRWLLEHEYNNQ